MILVSLMALVAQDLNLEKEVLSHCGKRDETAYSEFLANLFRAHSKES